jgi:hypothetical protein
VTVVDTERLVGPGPGDRVSAEGLSVAASGVLALRAGVELVGKYDGSGRQTDRFLAKRPEGDWVELTALLYLVVSSLDGRRTTEEIAGLVGEEIGRDVTADNIEFLLDEKLAPLGLITVDGVGDPDQASRPAMLLGLKAKKPLIPAARVQAMTRVLRHLFHLPLVLLVVPGFLAVDIHLLVAGHLGTSTAQLLDHPELSLVVFALLFASIVFHELGHASACAYGGATPGEIGGGFYLIWPALYTNVTDGYRLGRGGRVRTDLGGIYFNAIFALVAAGIYQVTGYTPLVLLVAATSLLIVEQLLPFVRFDGYWVLSDLAGVPDLFPRLSQVLRGLLPDIPAARARLRGGAGDPGVWSRLAGASRNLLPDTRRVGPDLFPRLADELYGLLPHTRGVHARARSGLYGLVPHTRGAHARSGLYGLVHHTRGAHARRRAGVAPRVWVAPPPKPGRSRAGVEELQPYARRIITVWAIVTAIILPLEFALTLILSPSLMVSMWLSLQGQYDDFRVAVRHTHISAGILDVISSLLVAIMFVGNAYILCYFSYRIVRGAARRWGTRAWRRAVITATLTATLATPVIWSALQIRLVHVTS